jgi:hypothetical protein
MSPVNWGLMPAPGFTYTNQVLTYARDEAKGDDGASLPVTGSNTVILDMNTFASVSTATILGGARYSASATLPFARNDLTSNLNGNRNGGAGSGDSYYPPLILGWKRDPDAVRVLCGFLAPTGRFVAGGTDNVGSGYWTLAPSSGQTFYLTRSQSLAASAYEWYEIHSRQEGTRTHPGDTFNPDYSLMRFFPVSRRHLQIGMGVAAYGARQTTAKTGPQITLDQSRTRYAVNALGFATSLAFPSRKLSFGAKFFEEFADRSTFQGFSLGSLARSVSSLSMAPLVRS